MVHHSNSDVIAGLKALWRRLEPLQTHAALANEGAGVAPERTIARATADQRHLILRGTNTCGFNHLRQLKQDFTGGERLQITDTSSVGLNRSVQRKWH